jgi:RNA polymerase sigma-70 factor, ECF subfamily
MAEGPVSAVASDEALLRRISAGDAEAFATFFRCYYTPVYRFALHMTGAASAADDVTQDVFLAVMNDAARYESGRSTAAAWLCGIARNYARRRFDQERRVVPLPESEGGDDGLSVTTDPIGELIHATRLEELRKAVLSLPLAYREVVVLCDLQEFSYADAAAAIGCAVGTVRSRLHRARALLVTKLRAAADQSPARGQVRCVV